MLPPFLPLHAQVYGPVSISIQVSGQRAPLLDTQQPGTVYAITSRDIDARPDSLPGRTVIDLVDELPGWLYEGNAVLHPRGSEYQVQFVLDGIPLTDNRSPGANLEIEAQAVEGIRVWTAGIPAEYGRKLGGVIALDTIHHAPHGFHGELESSNGSFATDDTYGRAQIGFGRNVVSLTADGAHTSWFENPPVLQNYTNHGTAADFAGRYERDLTEHDSFTLAVRHELSRFDVPNEQVQEAAGQRQSRDTLETIGTAAYTHTFTRALMNISGMVRDDTTHLTSNPDSTPIAADQDRGYRESYIKATFGEERQRQSWKAGFEADFTDIHEAFSYTITDPTQFDPTTPTAFQFFEQGADREQGAFVEDTIHLGPWNIAAGIRIDHYSLLVEKTAASPRLSVSRAVPALGMVAHFSYDRVFQTPAFENILLSSSAQVTALSPQFLRLPVQVSQGNYYEAGASKTLGQFRLDANYYIRAVNNYADDDQLLDTAISFPIAFHKARIYGAEGRLALPHWGRWSGFASYSYMVGSAYEPVTGGLFLGEEAGDALAQSSGRFWVSQDQRNTVRARGRFQINRRWWVSSGLQYGSGLPTEFAGDEADAIAQYGAQLVDRVNLDRGRVRPQLAVDAGIGAQFFQKGDNTVDIQAGGQNLNDRVNLIDFAGLFSGNAVAPPRSFSTSVRWNF